MSSTLQSQPSLKKIFGFRYLLLHYGYKYLFGKKPDYQMLVRNPYTRLESFFKNKLRVSPPLIGQNQNWQACQKIFFPYVGVQKTDSLEQIRGALLSLSFSDFVRLLPELYFKDPHLAPQYFDGLKIIRKGSLAVAIKCPVVRTIKLEDSEGLQNLAKQLDLDMSIRRNSTTDLEYNIEWNTKSRHTVQKIYQDDFLQFGYVM